MCIPLGIFSALHHNRFQDRIISLCSYAGLSLPSFFVALIFLYLASITGILPLGGMHSVKFETFSTGAKILDILKHLVIPAVVLSLAPISYLQRIMRSSILEEMDKPYVRVLIAKGLSFSRIMYIHVLRNALNPLITIFGYQIASLLSGAALVEIICGWPGLGQVMLNAVRAQDLYLVMGAVLMSGMLLIIGNLIADILLAFADPRIRYRKV